jgi:hypothetical protein
MNNELQNNYSKLYTSFEYVDSNSNAINRGEKRSREDDTSLPPSKIRKTENEERLISPQGSSTELAASVAEEISPLVSYNFEEEASDQEKPLPAIVNASVEPTFSQFCGLPKEVQHLVFDFFEKEKKSNKPTDQESIRIEETWKVVCKSFDEDLPMNDVAKIFRSPQFLALPDKTATLRRVKSMLINFNNLNIDTDYKNREDFHDYHQIAWISQCENLKEIFLKFTDKEDLNYQNQIDYLQNYIGTNKIETISIRLPEEESSLAKTFLITFQFSTKKFPLLKNIIFYPPEKTNLEKSVIEVPSNISDRHTVEIWDKKVKIIIAYELNEDFLIDLAPEFLWNEQFKIWTKSKIDKLNPELVSEVFSKMTGDLNLEEFYNQIESLEINYEQLNFKYISEKQKICAIKHCKNLKKVHLKVNTNEHYIEDMLSKIIRFIPENKISKVKITCDIDNFGVTQKYLEKNQNWIEPVKKVIQLLFAKFPLASFKFVVVKIEEDTICALILPKLLNVLLKGSPGCDKISLSAKNIKIRS